MTTFERHQQVAREQEQTNLVNCALLAAYIYGNPGGWYCICDGHIDGFRNDYAVVHSNPGNLACHSIRVVCLDGSELPEYQAELDEILNDQAAHGEKPMVATVTLEERQATLQVLREAAEEANVGEVEEWVETLCKSGCSDVSCCDWAAVAAAITGKA